MESASFVRSIAFTFLGLGACATAGTVDAGNTVASVARPVARIASPDGHDFAEVREHPAGGDAIYVNGAIMWPMETTRTAEVTTPPRWSSSSQAIALLAREQQVTRLVVVLVHGETPGEVLEWEVPRAALPAKVITWLGAGSVSVGSHEMEPKLVATWKTPAPR
jgi:hypothetical protein